METPEDVIAKLQRMQKAGAQVKPLTEAPADIQAMAAEDEPFTHLPKHAKRKPIPVWRVTGGGWFHYADGDFEAYIPDVRLDVFLAFTSELQAYAAAAENGKFENAFKHLARAFVLLHHRPRFWERWRRRVYFVNTRRAVDRLVRAYPGRALYTFVPLALAEYHGWVTGKKKTPSEERPDIPVTPKP